MEKTESAKVFDRWVAFSIISSALRKKVSFKLGRLTYYSNLFIVLVAEPGVARKTQAINFGMEIVESVPDIIMSADATTIQALFDDLESSAVDEPMKDGTLLRHSSVYSIQRIRILLRR